MSTQGTSGGGAEDKRGMMTCQELVELVTEYLEGTMPAADRERFDAHLEICPGCVTYVEQIRDTIRLVGRSAVAEPDALPGMDELLATFRDFRASSAPRRPSTPHP